MPTSGEMQLLSKPKLDPEESRVSEHSEWQKQLAVFFDLNDNTFRRYT